MESDKMVKIGATDCNDVVCQPGATNCLIQAETALASSCIYDGFGWTHRRTSLCDVCGLNFFSKQVVSKNNLVKFNRCEECPQNYYTADIGMTHCIRCPDFHVRRLGANVCSLCPMGMRYSQCNKIHKLLQLCTLYYK